MAQHGIQGSGSAATLCQSETTSPEKRIEVTSSERGYAHTRFQGTCSPDVTVEDIRKQFYHSYFGGRDAWVRNGQWGAVRHDD